MLRSKNIFCSNYECPVRGCDKHDRQYQKARKKGRDVCKTDFSQGCMELIIHNMRMNLKEKGKVV